MENPVIYNIKLQAYQLPGFDVAVDEYNKYHKHNPIWAYYTELPMDDDGIIFFDVKIEVTNGNPIALFYLGKCWKS